MKNTIKLATALLIYVKNSLFKPTNPPIWLLGERRAEAKDNSYHLFKYIRINHPDEAVYYVIDANSRQRERVACYGNIIDYNSLEHYCAILSSAVLVQAFQTSTFPESKLLWYLFRLKIFSKRVAMIQHGITKDFLEHFIYNRKFKYDLIVAGARCEHEYMLTALNYPPTVARYLGLARWDALHDALPARKKIFVMPTWRTWLKELDSAAFLSSDFCKAYQELLHSTKLHTLLEEYGYELVFYLHDAIQSKWPASSESLPLGITFATSATHDVHELIKESKLLLTDYSSVAFDFAYLNKLTIYFQFDKNRYRNGHFKEGYFDYDEDGFGPVHTELDDIIWEIERFLTERADYSHYHNRMLEFFPLKDQKNCERNYKAIRAIVCS